jgi:glycine cleavage system H protein
MGEQQMSQMKYTEEHEWLRLEEDGSVTIGITDYAQEQLGDVVYVELPQVGTTVSAGDESAIVESVKAAGEVKSPISGEVISVNEKLSDEPELVNLQPTEDGWFFTIMPESLHELEELMSENDYNEYLETL